MVYWTLGHTQKKERAALFFSGGCKHAKNLAMPLLVDKGNEQI